MSTRLGVRARTSSSQAVDHGASFRPNVQGSPPSDVDFGTVYAPDTTQSHPGSPGLFHFWLGRGFDTRRHPNGAYELQVEAGDVRGNVRTAALELAFANA